MGSVLIKNIVALVLVGLVSGCAAPDLVRRFEGEKKLDEISVIYNTREGGLHIYEIDGEKLANNFTTWNGSDGVVEVQVLPGEHRIQGQLIQGNMRGSFDRSYSFAAGKKYRMAFKIVEKNKFIVYPQEVGGLIGH